MRTNQFFLNPQLQQSWKFSLFLLPLMMATLSSCATTPPTNTRDHYLETAKSETVKIEKQQVSTTEKAPPKPVPTQSGMLKIRVARFGGDPADHAQSHIIKALKEGLSNDALLKQGVDIGEIQTPIIGATQEDQEAHVEQVATAQNASIIVWGEVTSSSEDGTPVGEIVYPTITVLRPQQAERYTLSLPIGFVSSRPAFPMFPHKKTTRLSPQSLKELTSQSHLGHVPCGTCSRAALLPFIHALVLFEQEKWQEAAIAFDTLVAGSGTPVEEHAFYAAYAHEAVYTMTNKTESLERAITLLNNALEVNRANKNGVEYALVQRGLGIIHRTMGGLGAIGDTPEQHFRRAIDFFQDAAHFQQERNEIQYAVTQNDLGLNYQMLATLGVEQELHLRLSIEAFNEAIRTGQGENVAIAKNNIGLSYQTLASWGIEPQKNLAIAMDMLHESAAAFKEQNSADYSVVKYNIGMGYYAFSLWGVEPTSNLRTSIETLREAAALWKDQQNKSRYAMAQGSIGAGYQALASWGVDTEKNLQSAVGLLQDAARMMAEEQENKTGYPIVEANLGLSYQALAVRDIDAVANFEQSIASLEEAATLWKKQNNRAGFAMAKNNLGVSYQGLVQRNIEPEKNKLLSDQSFKEARLKDTNPLPLPAAPP